MAAVGGIWVPMAQRLLRHAAASTAKMSKALRTKLITQAQTQSTQAAGNGIRTSTSAAAPRQPVHPLAFLRQQKKRSSGTARWYSSSQATVRRFLNTAAAHISEAGGAPHRFVDRTAYLKSAVGSRAVWQSTGRAPFASTLRPNLTGGALPRTAGGYGMPGAGTARCFSHTPAAPAQVVQNVSQAMRAFWLSGQRARFDGVDARSGRSTYRAISAKQDEAARRMGVYPSAHAQQQVVPGSYVDFALSPTITALSPLAAAFPYAMAGVKPVEMATATTLGEEGFLDILSVDFARTLKELSAVMNDLKRLASLGDLPILLEKGSVLRVRFPGVDAETVESLCDDLGVTRGVVRQDRDFDTALGVPVALRFPFAPGAEDDGRTITSPGGSMRSHRSDELSSTSEEDEELYQQFMDDNPWLSAPTSAGELEDEDVGYESMSPPLPTSSGHAHVPGGVSDDFEGLEGIYRFLEECDRARQRPLFR